MSSIKETLQAVEKIWQTPTYIEGPIMMRENLDAFVNRLPLKETPIRDRMPRKKGSGAAASWNVLTAFGVGNSPFAEGGTPTEDDTTYDRRSAVYKEFGKVKSITDRALAAGASFTDMESELTEVAIRETIQDEEQLLITGDTGVSALEFDGLRAQITTNVTDDNNNALGFRTVLLDNAIKNIIETYGVRPTSIYCGYGMKVAINQSLAGDLRVNLDATNEVATGIEVGMYQSMIGKLPFVATFAIAGDSVTYPGNTVEDIYVITENAQGQAVLYLEDLYGLGKSMLDRTGAAIKFMVTQATVFVNRSEEMHERISNVRVA